MRRSSCAAAVFGIALAVGAVLGAAVVFVLIFMSLRTTPAARPDLDSLAGAAGVAAIAALVGAIVGVVVAAAAWSTAALVLIVVNLRWRTLVVRACAVSIGSAAGAALVLWFLATRPGTMLDARLLIALVVVSAMLAGFALLVSERINPALSPRS